MNKIKVPSIGLADAKVMIVGEAPGREEEVRQVPFIGASGIELTNALHEVGFTRAELFITNVCKYRPPNNDMKLWRGKKNIKEQGLEIKWFRDKPVAEPLSEGLYELFEEIKEIQPNLIIALGETALWALTGNEGITAYRGSYLETDIVFREDGTPFIVIPTLHPAYILRQYAERFVFIADLKKAYRLQEQTSLKKPKQTFKIKPTFKASEEFLLSLIERCSKAPLLCAVDIETNRDTQAIECIGFALSAKEAFCLPFFESTYFNYWSEGEELVLVELLRKLLSHENFKIIGHNFNFDAYLIAHWWQVIPNLTHDTMTLQHVCFPLARKSLAFCASLYCDYYSYWKEERTKRDKLLSSDESNWIYNCKDCCYTFEVFQALDKFISFFHQEEQAKFLHNLYLPILYAELVGVKVDKAKRNALAKELQKEQKECKEWVEFVVGKEVNLSSPKQLATLFYKDLGISPIINRATKKPTCNEEALLAIAKKAPLLSPVITKILAYRSLGAIKGSFIGCQLSPDGRFRCTYNVSGTNTFRLSSNKNPFGEGCNGQNATKGDKNKEEAIKKKGFFIPNVRELLVPDEGELFFDIDLDRADAQVVAWDADDAILKQMFKEGADIHNENALVIYGQVTPETRQKAKTGVHAVNYLCQARTLAIALGITVREAELFIRRWLGAHPQIEKWQRRVENSLMQTRTVTNAFGFRAFFTDRPQVVLREALAWIPQSTVGIVINKAWLNIYNNAPFIKPLLQVHDSSAGTIKIANLEENLSMLKKEMEIVVPYKDPLVIPVGLQLSPLSWGAVEKRDW